MERSVPESVICLDTVLNGDVNKKAYIQGPLLQSSNDSSQRGGPKTPGQLGSLQNSRGTSLFFQHTQQKLRF